RRRLHLALATLGLVLLGLAALAGGWLLQHQAEQQQQDLLGAQEKKRSEELTALKVKQATHEQQLLRDEEQKHQQERARVAAAPGQRVAASPARAELVAALEDWALEEADAGLRRRLWHMTAKVTGQAWRADLAAALGSKEAVEALLARVPPAEMTPALLAVLG